MRELERTEFHNEFGRRHHYFGGLSTVISASETGSAVVSVCRRKTRPFGEAQVALMRELMPHLKRALQVHARLVEADARAHGLGVALHALDTGAMLVGNRGRVLFVNDSARATLALHDGLTIERGELRAERPRDTAALRGLISGAAETGSGAGLLSGGVLLLGRPSSRRALQLIVSPVSPGEALMEPRAHAIIFVTDPERVRKPDVALLRRVHGLSRSEADVAHCLLQDKSVRETSGVLGISINTVRFHLKQLFAKTGTARQSQLVRVLSMTIHVRP
jgi:DNA-binding CsgD family transcriptional regulator